MHGLKEQADTGVAKAAQTRALPLNVYEFLKVKFKRMWIDDLNQTSGTVEHSVQSISSYT